MNQNPDPITIAAFDFDGTLTRTDSMFEFIRFHCGMAKFYRGMVIAIPVLIGFKLKLIDRQRAKERLLATFFKGQSAQELNASGKAFYQDCGDQFLRKNGIKKLKWHQAQGHRCFLVTASLTWWTQPFADALGLELLATEPEIGGNGNFTGKILGKNCHGPEKVRRLETVLSGENVLYAYAYGDTSGDREMLAWADEGAFKPFRTRT